MSFGTDWRARSSTAASLFPLKKCFEKTHPVLCFGKNFQEIISFSDFSPFKIPMGKFVFFVYVCTLF